MFNRICLAASARLHQTIFSGKTVLILTFLIVFSAYIYIPVANAARFYQITVPPWSLPFFLSMLNTQILYGGVCVILFDDLFEVDGYAQLLMIRCGRRDYMIGQLLYVFSLSFLLTFLMMLLSIVFLIPVLGFETGWGLLFNTLGSDSGSAPIAGQTGQHFSFYVDSAIIAMSPLKAMLLSFAAIWSVTAMLGLIIGFFRVNVSKNSGIVIDGLMILLGMFPYGVMNIGLGRLVKYICLPLYAFLPALDWSNTGMTPSPAYGITVIGLLLLVTSVGSVIGFQRKDL